MSENIQIIESELKEKNIELKVIELDYKDSVNNWRELRKFFKSEHLPNIILNITTFPRETIWTILFFLRIHKLNATYIYYKPESYDNSKDGLTWNHKSPRLLFKHSGIFDIDKKLALFIITGFDYARASLLIEHYEPTTIVYLSQKGEQFENMKRNCGIEPKTAYESIDVKHVPIDSYNIDELHGILKKNIDIYSNHNIIIVSHGPKTSAISTYLAYWGNSDVALAYVPAREFNATYSLGFDENYIIGEVKF